MHPPAHFVDQSPVALGRTARIQFAAFPRQLVFLGKFGACRAALFCFLVQRLRRRRRAAHCAQRQHFDVKFRGIIEDAQAVAHLHFARRLGAYAVGFDAANLARRRGQCARFEKARRPQPFVYPQPGHDCAFRRTFNDKMLAAMPTTEIEDAADLMSRSLAQSDPAVAQAIADEARRQHDGLEMIASENFVSEAVLEAAGSVFTNKYAEGYPGKRYYGGCEFADVVENLARDRAKQLFGAEHANVQPHSGSQANAAAYSSVLQPGDTILGLDLAHGGHLTHGHRLNFSGKLYKVASYRVKKDTEQIDYDALEATAMAEKPKVIIGGGSAYSRIFDFPRMRAIADQCGALLIVDMAHFAGLVAGGVHPSPVPHAQIVTTTTHKTLRGPRAGMILSQEKYAKDIDRNVFPGHQGGPLVHIIAAKAVAFREALQPSFKDYAAQTVANARALAGAIAE